MPALYETNDASFIWLSCRSDRQDVQVYVLVCSYTGRGRDNIQYGSVVLRFSFFTPCLAITTRPESAMSMQVTRLFVIKDSCHIEETNDLWKKCIINLSISNLFSCSLNYVPNIMLLFSLFSKYLITCMLKAGRFVIVENSMWTQKQGGN